MSKADQLKRLLAQRDVLLDERGLNLPFVKWCAEDFLFGVRKFPVPVVGYYILLLCAQMVTGSLPADIGELAKILGMSSASKLQKLWDQHLGGKFTRLGDCVYSVRVERDRVQAMFTGCKDKELKERAKRAGREALHSESSQDADDIPF